MHNTEEPRKQRRSRLILLLLVAVFVVPLLAAAWLYRQVQQEGDVWGTTNHGRLIDPARPLAPFELETAGGETLTREALRGQWTLVFSPETPCLEDCRQVIYHMRQVRAALGREAPRVQRWLVLSGASQYTALADFLENYPGMQVLTDTRRAVLDQLEGAGDAPDSPPVYLVDPLGNLMMAFPRSLDPRDMLKDLKKLLKISQIG